MFATGAGRFRTPEISIIWLTPNTARIARTIPTIPSPAIIPEQKRIPSFTIASFLSLLILSITRRTRPPTIMHALR